jgi:hypothetical protein
MKINYLDFESRLYPSSFFWFINGRSVFYRLQGFLTRPLADIIIALMLFMLGSVVSIFGSEISEATKRFFEHRWACGIDFLTCMFWLAVSLWTILYYMKLLSNSISQSMYLAVIRGCPDSRVFRTYKNLLSHLQNIAKASSNNNSIALNKAFIRKAMRVLIKLVARYTNRSTKNFSANIMLIKSPENGGEEEKRLYFYSGQQKSMETELRFVLYMNRDLVYPPDKAVPLVSLPVPPARNSPGMKDLILPGAPLALLDGRMNVIDDTRELYKLCKQKGFDANVQTSVKEFFNTTGKGSHMRSFVSIRIGGPDNPLGVLNINSEKTNVLGNCDLFYETLDALMMPMLHLLQSLMERLNTLTEESHLK